MKTLDNFLEKHSKDPESDPTGFRVTRAIVEKLAEDMGGDVRTLTPPGNSYQDTELQKYVNMLLKGSPAAAGRTRFNGSPCTRSGDGNNDGGGRVHLVRLQEVLEKYNMDNDSSKARAQSGTSSIESSSVGGGRKEANASVKRAIALRERMARIRSETA